MSELEIETFVSAAAALQERADVLAERAGRAMSDCWERGIHPKTAPINVDAFHELALLVRDIARVMKTS